MTAGRTTAAGARAAGRLLLVLCTGVVLCGLALTAARASAVIEEIAETGRPGYLRLGVDSATPLQATLAPGGSMRWLVEASLLDAPRGSLAVQVDASGDLLDAGGMTARVDACTGAFELGGDPDPGAVARCRGERTSVLGETPLALLASRGDRFELTELRREAPRQLLVTISVPASTSAAAVAELRARIGLGVHVDGEDDGGATPPPGPPRIPVTGADALALGVLAAGLIGIGASLALLRGLRSGTRRRDTGPEEAP